MQILIDKTKLNLLLEKKKNYIGNEVTIDSIISAFSFLISSFFAEYKNYFGIPGMFYKVFFVLLGILFSGIVIGKSIYAKKNQYNYKDLLKDINALNEITHEHSIVVIKDTFNKFSNRYLVYKDLIWNCDFFPNYKTNENNENFIKEHLSNELKIVRDDINLKYVCKNISEKYYERTKEIKIYDHRFYLAEIKNFNDLMKNCSFEIDGKIYYWKTINELELDREVIKKNSDILNVVKYNF